MATAPSSAQAPPRVQRRRPSRMRRFLTLFVLACVLGSGYFAFGHRAVSQVVAPRPFTLLVLGVDADEEQGRTDTMMLVHFEPAWGGLYGVSLPRDSMVTIEGRKGYEKLNHAHAYGGPELAVRTVRQWLGVPIDGYVRFNFRAFERAVETVGGVELEVEKRMYYHDPAQSLLIDLQPGLQRLDGNKALQYVRYRDETGDIGRMERQQKFLRAFVQQALASGLARHAPRLAADFWPHVKTDISLTTGLAMARAAQALDAERLHLTILEGEPAYGEDIWYWKIDMEKAAAVIDQFIKNPRPPAANGK